MIVNNYSNVQLFKLLRGLENAGKYQPGKPDSIPHLQEIFRDSRSSIRSSSRTKSIQLGLSLAIHNTGTCTSC